MKAPIVVNIKKERCDIYIGRPSGSVRLNIQGRCSEAFRIVAHHANSTIAEITEGATKNAGRVVMIPSEVDSLSTDGTLDVEHSLATGTVGLLVQLGTIVSVFSASPITDLPSSSDVDRPAGSASCRPLFLIDLRQSMAPLLSLSSGDKVTTPQQSIVASNAETAQSQWTVTARDRTELIAFRRWGGGHSKHSAEPVVYKPFKWGNPYKVGKDGTRREVIEKYRQYIMTRKDLLDSLHELEGKRLGCFCAPMACHGDVLVELVLQQQ